MSNDFYNFWHSDTWIIFLQCFCQDSIEHRLGTMGNIHVRLLVIYSDVNVRNIIKTVKIRRSYCRNKHCIEVFWDTVYNKVHKIHILFHCCIHHLHTCFHHHHHHHHHIQFWYLWCCGCPGLWGRQHLATSHTLFTKLQASIQYWPTRPGIMIIVGRRSDGTVLNSFKTQSSATSPPSNNTNISLWN